MIGNSIINKFKYAGRGLGYIWRREKSFRWQVIIAILVQIVILFLQADIMVWALLTMISAIVLSAETFNTVLERLFDMIEPRLSSQVSLLKDLLAAAVLIIVLAAVIIALGLII